MPELARRERISPSRTTFSLSVWRGFGLDTLPLSGPRAKIEAMGAPYREQPVDGRRLEPDPAARRKVRLAGATTVALGLGIGATAPMLGPLVAAFGGGLALLGLALFREAPMSPVKASCPSCSAEIAEFERSTETVRCPSCGDYARVVSDMLIAIPDDFIASTPTFAIPLERVVVDLPPICAECGSRNARQLVHLEVYAHGSQLGAAGSSWLVGLPHCAEHASGAAADVASVRVRSRALWLAASGASLPSPPDEGSE